MCVTEFLCVLGCCLVILILIGLVRVYFGFWVFFHREGAAASGCGVIGVEGLFFCWVGCCVVGCLSVLMCVVLG